jgi:hypothetical protein
MGQAHYTEGMTVNTRGIPQTLDGQSNREEWDRTDGCKDWTEKED